MESLKTLLIKKPTVFATKLLNLRLSRELHDGSDLNKVNTSKHLTAEDIIGEFRRYQFGNTNDDKNSSTPNKNKFLNHHDQCLHDLYHKVRVQ